MYHLWIWFTICVYHDEFIECTLIYFSISIFLHAIHTLYKKEKSITTSLSVIWNPVMLLSLIQKSFDVFFSSAQLEVICWVICESCAGSEIFQGISWRYLFGKWLGKITLLTTPFFPSFPSKMFRKRKMFKFSSTPFPFISSNFLHFGNWQIF